MEQLFWYEGPASDNQKIENLTWEQVMQLKKQEDDLKAQQEADAQIGPNLNADIRQYVSQNPSVDPRNAQRQGQSQPAPQTALSSLQTSPEQQPQSNAPLGSPDFMSAVNKITQSQPSGAMSGLPVDGNTEQPKPSASQPMSNEMGGLLTGIPPELTRDLIWQYHNGQLKPSAFIKEIKEIRKNIYENDQINKNEAFKSSLKIGEQRAQDEGAMGRLDKQIGSNEKMNTEDNQTSLEIARINAENQRENNRAQHAALKAGEFDVKEKDMLQSVEEGKALLSGIVETFKNSNFGGVGSAIGETAAKVPFAGKFIAGKNKEYQNQKRLAAETWLRAATGAAAPAHEVDTYTNFLPNESDPPEVADKKIQNFFNKLSAKVNARAKIFDIEGQALEQRGLTDLANIKYTQAELVRQMVSNARNEIPSIVGDGMNNSNAQPRLGTQPQTQQPKKIGRFNIVGVQ